MNKKQMLNKLETWDACTAGCDWATQSFQGKSAEEAWKQCPEPTWLLWVAAMAGVDRKILVRVGLVLVSFALRGLEARVSKERLQRSLGILNAVKAWLDGQGSADEVRSCENQLAYPGIYAGGYAAEYAVCHLARMVWVPPGSWLAKASHSCAHYARMQIENDAENGTEEAALRVFNRDALDVIHHHITWALVEAALNNQTEE